MMRTFTLSEAKTWTQADSGSNELSGLSFSGVSTDTRSLEAGQLFVALRGDHFDGHKFLEKAQALGAVAAVVDTANDAVSMPQLIVKDTVKALAHLASGNRDVSDARLVAVTGSSGKTTVRGMTAAILSRMGSTLATQGNLNNHIGVPLTLFGLLPEHRYGAIELGASSLGEIAHTVAITKPEVAILTNAGTAHLEGFGSYENVVRAKGEIIDGVRPGGVVVLNRDDPAFELWQARAAGRKVVSVSRFDHAEADYLGGKNTSGDVGLAFQVKGPGGWSCSINLALEGDHNITNALLAVAAARALGASDQAIVSGLAQVQAVKGRLQALRLAPGLTVIDDSYNANPASMKAALAVLAARQGERIAILGAMAELGPTAYALHRDVGEYARNAQIERLLVVGPGCEGYVEGFGVKTEIYQTHN
ncbi:MAG TPA: UDP-N-acetylmuramoyl-tripeptide--D-alanyl-D-alanine ligase, partial [Marinobacter sp.]|nr:UDP-N-acetylmuramoyl-tripeptide--D-alanyl-D-alanine ligase [Marinobacter sp.]